jgi:hypothetical protein
MAAVMLAIGAVAFALGLQTSQRFLDWKVLRGRVEAAVTAGTLELDGTDAGIERARRAALAIAGVAEEQARIQVLPEGDGVRLTLGIGVSISAAARQRPVAEPEGGEGIAIAALRPEAANFGLVRGSIYKAKSKNGDLVLGRVVAVRVHSGFPKEVPLTWIAGRIIGISGEDVEIQYLGGYLRGAGHAAVAEHGYFEVQP